MTQMVLYTGNGVTLSPLYAEGRTQSRYIRLIADTGKGITNGEMILACVNALRDEISNWADCELPSRGEQLSETEQKALAYDILMGVSE